MKLRLLSSDISEVSLIEHDIFHDHRGSFRRLFCINDLEKLIQNDSIEQINYSSSARKGTVRGFHYQNEPFAEIKFIKVIKGSIFDVAINLDNYNWTSHVLSDGDNKILVIPKGFAHGFQTLSDNVEMLYLHTACYNSIYETGIHPLDPTLAVKWPLEITECSERDMKLPYLTGKVTHEV